MFEVKVEDVQVADGQGKTKRFGAMTGRRSDWKKAYVSLAAGQTSISSAANSPAAQGQD